jgi:hypothetical protein
MGGKTSTTTQQVTIPPEVLARYNAVNARAEKVAKKPFQIYSTDPSDFVAQLNEQQLTGIGNVNAAAGSYQPYLYGATGATMAGMGSANPAELEIGKYMNPFQQDVINSTMARMRQEQEQAQSGALGTAISSGAFGGDRAGIAAANLAQQQGMATGATLAGLNAQNYQQALAAAQQQQGVGLSAEQANLARLLSGGQQLAGLGQMAQGLGLQGAEAQINAGTLGQQTEQAGKTALYNQFQQQQAYDFQVAQFLANIAASTGALSGSTTTTTQPTSFWSDRRLKHDIKRIGKTDDGLPIYSFKYKGDDSEQTHVGFMADEVEQVKPDAVNTEPSGYKSVDYDRATKADGGGVAGPYGAMVGSQPGMGGYVPQAYLPVGEMMVADSSGLDNARMSAAQQLEAAANFGTNMVELKDKFGKGGEFWEIFQKNRENESRGGVVGYASGGPAYLEGGLKPTQNPVEKEGYLSGVVNAQEEAKKDQIMQPGSTPGQPQSGASQLGSLLGGAGAAMSGFAAIAPLLGISDRRMKEGIRRIGKTDDGMPIYKFKYKGDDREQTHIGFMADEVERKHPDAVMTGPDGMKRVDYGQAHKFYQGGVVRQGYQLGGGPETEEEIIRRRLLSGDVPKPTTLGDLPDARVTPAAEAMPNQDLSGLARAAIERAETVPAPASGLAPAASLRPQARPAPSGLATAKVPEAYTPPAEGGPSPIVPLKTQLDFVMHELAMPEYNSFLRAEYETPEQAAIGFEKTYERANGAGNDRAAAYARDVYSAVSSGDVSRLPPNAVAAFEHFTENGMDPIKAAGATGRLMVESYAHMDPNARNTLGGGYGTYGVAQWRGPRMEALADFAGVPMDAITSAPVSTPEGRYYSTGDGLGSASMGAGSQSSGDEEYTGGLGLTPDKPYAERNALGKMFYNPNGTVNKDALLSILSGIGTMASSPSLYLGSSILQGIGGAANTYAGLEERRSDIIKKRIDNANEFEKAFLRQREYNPEITREDFARSIGYTDPISLTDGLIGVRPAGDALTEYKGVKFSIFGNDLSRMVPAGDGTTIPAGMDYGYLKNKETWLKSKVALGITEAADALLAVQDQIAKIEANYGQVVMPDGASMTSPGYAETKFPGSQTGQDLITTPRILEALPGEIRANEDFNLRTDIMYDALKTLPVTGTIAPVFAEIGSIAQGLGITETSDTATARDTIAKQIAQEALDAMRGVPGATDFSGELSAASNPNITITPEAAEKIIAMRKAVFTYNKELHAALENGGNLAEIQREFAESNSLKKFYNDAYAEVKGTLSGGEMQRPGWVPEADWNSMSEEERQEAIAMTPGQGG